MFQFIYFVFVLMFIYKESRKLYRLRWNYFREFWSYIEVVVIIISVTGIVIYFYRYAVARNLTKKFADSHGNDYVKFQYVAFWNELLMYMIGLLVWLATFKFLKLLRFNRRISFLSSTFKRGKGNFFSYSIILANIYFAYVILFWGIFGTYLLDYSTPYLAAETLLQMTLGIFDYYAMRDIRPSLGPFMFFIYICTINFIFINMFISLLNESFSAVKVDAKFMSNDYEIVDFIISRLRSFFGLALKGEGNDLDPMQPRPDEYVEGDNDQLEPYGSYPVDEGPKRVDLLLKKVIQVFGPEDMAVQKVGQKAIITPGRKIMVSS